jgi:hypothetical protein
MFVFHPIKRCYGGSVQRGPVHRELRTVTRTIPACFERVPMQVAPEMRTGCRPDEQCPGLVTIGREFRKALTDNSPLPGFRSSNDLSSPGARYSAKFFTAVRFSLRKFPTALGVLRPGS